MASSKNRKHTAKVMKGYYGLTIILVILFVVSFLLKHFSFKLFALTFIFMIILYVSLKVIIKKVNKPINNDKNELQVKLNEGQYSGAPVIFEERGRRDIVAVEGGNKIQLDVLVEESQRNWLRDNSELLKNEISQAVKTFYETHERSKKFYIKYVREMTSFSEEELKSKTNLMIISAKKNEAFFLVYVFEQKILKFFNPEKIFNEAAISLIHNGFKVKFDDTFWELPNSKGERYFLIEISNKDYRNNLAISLPDSL